MIIKTLFSGILAAYMLFSYGSPDGKSALRFAWSADGSEWTPVAEGYGFLSSDFGPWGSGKRIYDPQIGYSDSEGTWYVWWKTLDDGSVWAVAKSADLCIWKPQAYYRADEYPKHLPSDLRKASPASAAVGGQTQKGVSIEVDNSLIDNLEAYAAAKNAKAARIAESVRDDATRFEGLTEVSGVITPYLSYEKRISDHLMGIFFEDINYGADGGLYAELVQNRDFEYSSGEQRTWDAMTSWKILSGSAEISTEKPLHANNPHHLDIQGPAAVVNGGWDGMSVRKGEGYDFSFFVKGKGKISVSLTGPDGSVLASAQMKVKAGDWTKYEAVLTPTADCSDASLSLSFPKGAFSADMVSLFPQNTFKGRKNGLRKDLAETLAAMKPRFVRFPGGCVAHGNGLDNMYDWKGSVGPLEARKPLRNIWNYHQTRGLGYYEYFQFCEDIGALALPVLPAGVPCQNSGIASHYTHDNLTLYGQQEGLPMEEMDGYIQDVLDLIEWANGPADSKWGKVRADAGHPEPFGLKYVGIGNEDLISEVFEERFRMIYDAVRKAHPEIQVVGTVGPFYEGSDYDEGWALARELSIPLVDEHYYVAPGWMVWNQDFYDNYERGKTKVYLGEYAAHTTDRKSDIESAIAEALYLTSVERNGDVVDMCSYAPLLAKKGHYQWHPDLIWFDNENIYPTVNYQVQKLFGTNSGSVYVPSELSLFNSSEAVRNRIGVSLVRDGSSYILKVVNYLPVPFKATLDAGGYSLSGLRLSRTTLAGSPESEDAAPVKDSITLGGDSLSFPAYSLTVLRLEL